MVTRRGMFLLTAMLLLVILTGMQEINAMNTGFSIEEMTESERNEIKANVRIIKSTAAPPKRRVQCFDVNEEGMLAIGQQGAQNKEICIYAPDGSYLYGYSFNCTQSFAVEWGDECINIYLVRSDVLLSLDANGNILEINKVQDTISNNHYRNYLLHEHTRTVGENRYELSNDAWIFDMLAMSYSQIVSKDAFGTERIVYDVSLHHSLKIVSIFAVIFVLVLVVALCCWKGIKRGQ